MKISTRTRYGTRLMVELALHHGKVPVFLKDVARNQEISEKYLSQIIIPLRRAGLVTSFRGAHGGYMLSRPPAQISVKDIVLALEGSLDVVHCLKDDGACPRAATCVTQELWRDLANEIQAMLELTTLEKLVKRSKEKENKHITYSI
jgi:Rrf2 family protein